MEQGPVPFTVWGLPSQDAEPYDEPYLDHEQRVFAVSVHHGHRFGRGPGAVVTSYDPQRARGRDDNLAFPYGPLALGSTMAEKLLEPTAHQTKLAEPRVPTQDAFIRCGNRLVPGLRLDIGIPEVTVIVSADLLTHPVAIGLWRWHVEMPSLGEVCFV